MTLVTLCLIFLAALFHSIWNIIAKSSKHKLTLMWLQMMITSVFFVPYAMLRFGLPAREAWPTLIFSSVMQITYYVLLSKCYRSGSISIVYPLTRGSAPMFVCLFSILLGTEHFHRSVLLAVFLMVLGIYLVNMPDLSLKSLSAPFKVLRDNKSTRLSILIGVVVSAYTISDKQNVRYCDPLLIYTVISVIPALCLAPFLLRRQTIREELSHNGWIKALIVAAFTFLAYYLVLVAMKDSDASYVSSIREISVVFVAIYSAIREKGTDLRSKVLGSVVIFISILLFACL